jgi:hypothetical protein
VVSAFLLSKYLLRAVPWLHVQCRPQPPDKKKSAQQFETTHTNSGKADFSDKNASFV